MVNESIMWLRYMLNRDLPQPVISDWQAVFDFAQKQALLGICFPGDCRVQIDKKLLYRWMSAVQQLRAQNLKLNKRATELSVFLKEAGFRCCILKGQGNATMYPDAGLRCPGDIDVWVDADEEMLYGFVERRFPNAKKSLKHIKFPIFSDAEVDIHYTPLKLYYPRHNRRLQQWLQEQKEEQLTHLVKLPEADAEVSIPMAKFNAVYQLGHILIHILDQGIGLRQLVDYFYVLKQLEVLSDDEKQVIVTTWKELGMLELASAVMWVEHDMLGLSQEYLLVSPNERIGRLLAEDILEGGNFGHYSERQGYRKYGRIVKSFLDIWRYLRLLSCMPGEAISRCFGKVGTAVRLVKKSF